MSGLPSTIIRVTDDVAADFVSRVFAPIANTVSGPLWIAVTLFVAVYGYMVMTGQVQHLYQSALRNVLIVGFVTYTALNWDWFSYLYETFTRSPELFSSKVALGRSEKVVLDELYNRGMDTAFSIWSRSGWDLALWGLGAVVFIVSLCLVAFAVFLLLLAKLLVAITLGLGPIFVSFFLFEPTRQWFKNWIASLMTLVVFQIVVYATLGLGYAIYQVVVPEGELYTSSAVDAMQLQGRVLPLIVIFLSLLFVLKKADGHAMALVGSMSYVGDAASHVFRSAHYAMARAGRYGPRIGWSGRAATPSAGRKL
jgi:type IV secretion system protein VirB6